MQTIALAAAAGIVLATGGFAIRTQPPVQPAVMLVRSASTARHFQRLHPCPSTGLTYGGCPGYVRDHIAPLCAGGADSPANMQWQTVRDALSKDRLERQACRR